eukprot:TRINITY_DN13130_c0_g1_i1.p1 TRINITY_DN13130_c0_g1~~TRINITY_DN13130_c0_g1_i1.p1  ORF type:complete len:389 (+),score=71.38 TRINITY_DN13130_c0_g1_i1:94-1260(+)
MDAVMLGSALSSLQTAGIGLAMAMFVGTELRNRFGLQDVNVRAWCARILVRSWPETLALIAVLFFAILLRVFINPDRGVDINDPVQVESWAKIKREWPILMGADTLLNLQGMMRLLVWAVVVLRLSMTTTTRFTCRKVEEVTSLELSKVWEFAPLAGSAAALSLAAATTRAAIAQQTTAYSYDGPLGGPVPIWVETTTVPFLTAIALKLAGSTSMSSAAGATGLALWLSSRNYFNLSGFDTDGNYTYDKMFIFAHCLELLASFAFLANTIRKSLRESTREESKRSKRSAWNGFVHLMLPLQQALPAYYWLTAFEAEREAEMTAAGRPFCLLKIFNLIGLAVYLTALAFYLAECLLRGPSAQDDGNDSGDAQLQVPVTSRTPLADTISV